MIFEEKRKWIKAENVKNGDILTIVSDVEIVTSGKYTYKDGTPKKDIVCKVKVNDVEYDMTVNATKKKMLIKNIGKDSSLWVGKSFKCEVVKVMVGDDFKDSILLSPITSNQNSTYEA